MASHTHDDVDWVARLPAMRRADELDAEALGEVAARLTAELPEQATVVDVGSGTGGMSAAMAAALGRRGGGRLVLDHPAPATQALRGFVVDRISWLAEIADERIGAGDRDALARLLASEAPEFLGNRDDLFLLGAHTVHHGRLVSP